MTCAHKENLAAWLDGELSEADSSALRSHVESCTECREYAELLTSSYAALERIEEVSLPEGFASRVTAKVRRRSRMPIVAAKALAFAAAVLLVVALSFDRTTTTVTGPAPISPEEMAVLENINVIENYDVASDVESFADFEVVDDLDEFEGLVAVYSGGAS